MKCLCGNEMVMKLSTNTMATVVYNCVQCGLSWSTKMENMCVICGGINSFIMPKVGKLICNACNRNEIAFTYTEKEWYISRKTCKSCGEEKYVIMLSDTSFKCLKCNGLQNEVIYAFIKNGDNISEI